jgi:hypothetical protein
MLFTRLVMPISSDALGRALLLLSLVPLGFLVYTLLNLGRLRITLAHPRVIVELSIFLLLLALGLRLALRR